MKNTFLLICSTNILVRLPKRKYEELSYPQKSENVRPRSSNSIEIATPSSGTSPLASYNEVLGILSFLPFSFSQKFSYFVSDSREYHFFSSLVNKQLGHRAWKRGWSMVFCPSSLVFNQIYHDPFTSFPIKYTIESLVYCSHLPNLVSVGWFWRLSRRIGANPKRRNNLNE